MNRQRRNACLLGDLRHGQAVLVVPVPAGADLQGDRHINRSHYGLQDLGHQCFILQQRGPGGLVADLFRRTAHVDINNLCAKLYVGPGRIRQHLCITTGDLYRAGLGITFVDHAHPRFAGVPQAHVAGDHFRDYKSCAQSLAQLTKGLVCDPRHRGENQAVVQCVRTDAYRRHRTSLLWGRIMRVRKRVGMIPALDDWLKAELDKI